MIKTWQALFTLLFINIIFAVGIWIQAHIFLCEDISWLIHAAARLLAGGNYYDNFFEVNTPMAIFIHIPIVLLARYFSVKFYTGLAIETFIIIITSLVFCYCLLTRLVPNDSRFVSVFLISLSFVFILLPTSQLGQREHFLVVMTMPYLLLMALRCENKAINNYFAVAIGIFAGVAVLIKPYFLLVWLLLELYFVCRKKTLRVLFRAENISIVIITLIYAVAAIIFTAEYFTKVIPLILHIYYTSYAAPWQQVVTHYGVCYYVFTTVLYVMLRKNCTYKSLLDLLQVIALAFLAVYLVQHTVWYYHILPLMSACTLLLTVLLYEYLYHFYLPALKHDKLLAGEYSVYVVIMSALLFLMPITVSAIGIEQGLAAKQNAVRIKMIDFVKNNGHGGSIYFFSDQMNAAYPLVDYANTESASRFCCLWMLSGFSHLEQQHLSLTQSKVLAREEEFFHNAVIEDLLRYQPTLLFFVLKKPVEISTNNPLTLNITNHYNLHFMQRDPRFVSIMQNYTAFTIVGNYLVFKRNTL